MTWLQRLPPWVAALPWLIGPLAVLLRMRDSRYLTDYAPARDSGMPRVSVIVPARDEALNIERCVRSILATTYANVELIVIDDHSADGTGRIAHSLVSGDARARVTTPPPLPDGWFGKQWACAHGAALATGNLLLFTDADTWHAPDLIARSVTALRDRGADLLSIAGRQEAGTFWEKVGQPAVFVGLFSVFGGTEAMSRSHVPKRKIANGQCFLARRDTYDAVGGHEAVRMYVAEDAMLAQTWTAAGHEVHLVVGLDHLSTRMYRSVGEMVRGWGKNAWAGGRHMFADQPWLVRLMRVAMPIFPWNGVVPVIALVAGALGLVPSWWTAFGAWASAFQTVVWFVLYAATRSEPVYAVLYPLGCVLTSYIFARASIRGDKTEWKGREYMAA